MIKYKNKKPKIIYLNTINDENLNDVFDANEENQERNNSNIYVITDTIETNKEANDNNIDNNKDTTKENVENSISEIINKKDTTENIEEKNKEDTTTKIETNQKNNNNDGNINDKADSTDSIEETTKKSDKINTSSDKVDSIDSTNSIEETTKESGKINTNNEMDTIEDDKDIITNDLNNNKIEEYDELDYVPYKDSNYATLTPTNGHFDHIYIHLGGICEFVGYFRDFFKSNETFIPKGTKIYYLSGKPKKITQYMKDRYMNDDKLDLLDILDWFGIIDGFKILPSWFNVDSDGKLVCENCNGDDFAEAKESLNLILDTIDQISKDENIDYDKIYLGGFSQGAIMVNYVLLNSRHKLGGYLAFSGYVFDHHFPPNYVVNELTDEQKQILESKKDYHILAAHSFNDDAVFYSRAIESYYTYYKNYTDFTLLSFGKLDHNFEDQPTHPFVRKWLKESMGK